MSFKEWLYAELINDGYVDEEDFDIEDMDEDTLLAETDVDEMDMENYRNQFVEHCAAEGTNPIWDLD